MGIPLFNRYEALSPEYSDLADQIRRDIVAIYEKYADRITYRDTTALIHFELPGVEAALVLNKAVAMKKSEQGSKERCQDSKRASS